MKKKNGNSKKIQHLDAKKLAFQDQLKNNKFRDNKKILFLAVNHHHYDL